MSQTPKSHKICQITQESEKYNITNSCLLVPVDNLKTKTDKDDCFCLAAICQFSHRKFVDNLQVASVPEHSIYQRAQRKIAVELG